MSESIVIELRVFLIFVLHGSAVLLCNDLLRSWRIVVPHTSLWTGLEDLFFWFTAAIWTFVLVFLYQDGQIRLYMLAALGLGMYFYHRTVSRWIIRFVSGVLRLVFCFVSRFFRTIDNFRQKTVAKFVRKE